MSIPVADSLDLLKQEILNAVLQNLAVAPAQPRVGQYFYDTVLNTGVFWDGTTWQPFLATKLPDGSIQLSKLAVNPLDRANHTGTQNSSTIQNFDTAVRANRLDQMTAPTAPINMNGQRLENVGAPMSPNDAATKQMVEDAIALIVSANALKGKVRAAVGTNINLAAPGNSLNSVTPAPGDAFLLYGQTDGTQNGPYVWTAAGTPMARADNWNTQAEAVVGSYWIVAEGTYADHYALMTNDAFTLGSSALVVQFTGVAASYVAGDGIVITGNSIAVKVAASGGLTNGPAGVAIDPAVVVRKVIATITGDGVTTAFSVVHGLGTLEPDVSMREDVAPRRSWLPSWDATDLNTVNVKFGIAPAAGLVYKVSVQG
jgi:hypothetical protein